MEAFLITSAIFTIGIAIYFFGYWRGMQEGSDLAIKMYKQYIDDLIGGKK